MPKKEKKEKKKLKVKSEKTSKVTSAKDDKTGKLKKDKKMKKMRKKGELKKMKKIAGGGVNAEKSNKTDISLDPKDYNMPETLLDTLKHHEIVKLFPIQAQTFDLIYEGMDIIGKAYTGSGKTLAFVLPVIATLMNKKLRAKPGDGCSVLCLAPTRELSQQVAGVFKEYSCGLKVCNIYGGASYDFQIRNLQRGSDIVVGTVGRVKDMIEQKHLKLSNCKYVILDEADEMLNIGFAEEVEEILSNLDKEEHIIQTLLFSATIPQWINSIVDKYMRKERRLVDLVTGNKQKASKDVEHMALCCHPGEREEVLADLLLIHVNSDDRVMIFSETKKACNELAISEHIKQECQVLHGDVVQKQREITTKGFRDGRFPVLICTDVAARGLDIKKVQLIIQLMPPGDPETYIHRSGRTGRAGLKGKSILFYAPRDRWKVELIERKAGLKFNRIGAPQRTQLAKKIANETIDKIREIPARITEIFMPMAEKFVAEMDGEKLNPKIALANAFALVSGYTNETNVRSVLSCSRNFVTILATTDEEVRGAGYVFSQLEKLVSWDLRDAVRGMTLLESKRGAVFDCPKERVEALTSVEKPWIKFEKVETLPELAKDAGRREMSSRGRYSQRGRGGRGGRGSYNRSGGRGYGRGRGRGRGSGRGYGSRGRGYGSRGSSRGRGSRGRGNLSGGSSRGVGKRGGVRFGRGRRGSSRTSHF